MSLKKIKQALSKPTIREMAEIQKEHQEVLAQAALAQYRCFVHEEELLTHNKRLVEINREGAARLELDKAKKEKEEANAKS